MSAAARSTRIAVSVTLGLVALSIAVMLFVTLDLSLHDSVWLFLIELVGLAVTLPFLYVGVYRLAATAPLAKGTAGFSLVNCVGFVLYAITVASMVILAHGMTHVG
jgi:hypothetical protein